MNTPARMITALSSFALLSGCGAVSVDRSFDRARSTVDERIGAKPEWPATADAHAAIDTRVRELLREPIDEDRAVAIALINNRRLRTEFASLGFAEADLKEAGLLDNPSLSVGAGFPDRPPSITGLDFGLTINLLRLLILPARRDIASLRLDAQTLAVADAVLYTAAETRRIFLDLQAAEHLSAILRELAIAAEASADFARRVHDAGNLSELSLANEQSLSEHARLEYARSIADVADRRERLNAQLGLWGDQTSWTIVNRLPSLPPGEPDLSDLESLAIRQRLDLAAAAKEVEAIAKSAGLQRDWRFLLTSEVGFNASRDTDGQWVFGPELSLELPIFNQRQPEIARLDSALLAAEARLEALAIETRADVRRLRDRLFATRYEAERYRDTIVPLHERITALTLQQYNFMLADTFDLLAAKRQSSDAYRSYLQSVHDYWAIRAELERAVGGRLPITPTPAMPEHPSPIDPSAHRHGGH